jgi:hypothetical protein
LPLPNAPYRERYDTLSQNIPYVLPGWRIDESVLFPEKTWSGMGIITISMPKAIIREQMGVWAVYLRLRVRSLEKLNFGK